MATPQPTPPTASTGANRPPAKPTRLPPGTALLGLALEGTRLQGVVLRRTNGSVQVQHPFAVTLSLDPLSDAPELVGREIRKHLDAAGIRERRCTVCIPVRWVLTLNAALPNLPEPDLQSVLQIEAERGFPYAPDALILDQSRHVTPSGEPQATLVAVPRDHVTRLQQVLQAAQLRPLSFSLGITALQPPESDPAEGRIALAPLPQGAVLQLTCGGGIALLRTLAAEPDREGAEPGPQVEQLVRETRITLGQLPENLRAQVRTVQVLASGPGTEELARRLRERLEPLGLRIETVEHYPREVCGVALPARTPVSGALSLALRQLTGHGALLEFLPPKVSRWQQYSARYSAGKLAWVGLAAGLVVLAAGVAFGIQQWRYSHWNARWSAMKAKVTELDRLQQQIKQFRPWFDDSCRSLAVWRRLAEAFPEDGAVSAKTLEIRAPGIITCVGTARDNPSLLKALDGLRAAPGVSGVQVVQIRGRSPLQFTFNFQWSEGGRL